MAGCSSSGGVGPAAVGAPSASAPSPEPADPTTPSPRRSSAEPLRVLVTGFNDWRELGDPPNVWRCRDNPSCRLLLGDPQNDRPSTFAGPLAEQLRAHDELGEVEWTFATLPVTWEVAKRLPEYAEHDVVVHLGLGVYDRTDVAYVEDGAVNRRRGTDAAGRTLDEAISASVTEDEVRPPEAGVIAQRVQAVDGRRFGPLEVRAMPARDTNAYLCNETHFWALRAVEDSRNHGGRLEQAYFVHIPYPATDDYAGLAEGVAGLVLALLSHP